MCSVTVGVVDPRAYTVSWRCPERQVVPASIIALHARRTRHSFAFIFPHAFISFLILARYLRLRTRLFGHRFSPVQFVLLPPRAPARLEHEPTLPTMPKAATGYYAVAKGFNPGIYGTWDDCESQTKGFPGARHKKFKTEAEANNWLAANGVSSPASYLPAPESTASTSTASRFVSQKSTRFSPVVPAPKGKAKEPSRGSNSLLGKNTIADTTGWQIVYCDGACRGNGKPGAVAGVGVWWGPGDVRNIAERCPGDQTNNRAELIAIVRILETVPPSKTPLLIRTDSSYSIKCFKDYLPNWKTRGFKTSSGGAVKNLGIIMYIDALLQERMANEQKVHFEYVKGHSGDVGNEGADHQANVGCELPLVPDRDWATLEAGVRKRTQKPPGAGYHISQPSVTAAIIEPTPSMSLAELEDLAQYMTNDPAADLSD